jgi:hypothetical protein
VSRGPPTLAEAVGRLGMLAGCVVWARLGPLDPDAPPLDECVAAAAEHADPVRARAAGALIWVVWRCPPLHRWAEENWR